MTDIERAKKALFDTYWSSTGWRADPSTPPDELEHAIKVGVMFSNADIDHADSLTTISTLRKKLDPKEVGRAFLASLSTKDVHRRSALGSLSVALNLPSHDFIEWSIQSCGVCGDSISERNVDINVLSFERFKWGGVRHTSPTYIAFDLARFAAEEFHEPSKQDHLIFSQILDSIEATSSGHKLADLVSALATILPGNKDQRRTAISILGFSGVLKIPGRPGFFREFTSLSNREETPWFKDDWSYPTCWWRGGCGLDQDALSFWFGDHKRG